MGAQYEASNSMGVGGIETDDSAASAGAAYVFRRAFGAWSQQAYVKASNTEPGDAFGFSVGLSPEGTVLAVGAPKEDSDADGVGGDDDSNEAIDAGAVYLFALESEGWRQTTYVKASNPAADSAFGFSVDLSANALDLVVGAASENSEATGLNGDEGDLDATRAGAAYLFKYASAGWMQRAYLKASNTDPYDRFGNSVVVSSDGSVVAIGAYVEDSSGTNPNDNASENAGAVYVY